MSPFLSLAAFFVFAPSAFAQQQPPPNVDQENPDQTYRRKTEQQAAEASKTARESAPLSGDPTFADILESPDNPDLNMRYARAQIRAGDIRGASTTLERLTMLRPDDPRVRLLYGILLYRLDDAVEAQRELEVVLQTPNLPAEVRSEAANYLALTRARQRDTHYEARISIGAGYDYNRSAAPSGGGALFAGVPIVLNADTSRLGDRNVQFAGTLGADHDFGGPKGHSIFAQVSYFRGEQHSYHLLNLQAYTAKVGGVLRTPCADITPSVAFNHILLDQGTYLRSRDSSLRVERHVAPALTTWFEFTHSYQDYVNTPEISIAEDRTGDQLDFSLGAAWAATSADRLSLIALHRRKYARQVYDAYRRESGTVEWLHLLGSGVFAQASFTGQFDRYEIPDPTVAPTIIRHDDGWIAQALVGAPLSLLWSPLRDFTGTVSYQYLRESSKVINYDYFNHEVSALLTYKWGI